MGLGGLIHKWAFDNILSWWLRMVPESSTKSEVGKMHAIDSLHKLASEFFQPA